MSSKDSESVRWRGDDAPTPLNPPEVSVSKDSPTIHILGALQELSSSLGLARSFLASANLADFDDMLRQVQRHLYIIKCDIASQSDDEIIAGKKIPRIDSRLVRSIDDYVNRLEGQLGVKPDRFILEAGSPAATALFLANEVARRAERLLVTLKNSMGDEASTLERKIIQTQQYLNHLSFQLYLMARVSNRRLNIPEESILTNPDSGEVMVNTEPLDG